MTKLELGGPVLSANEVSKDYGKGAGLVRAVDGVSLEVAQGESLAIVGPSGCGKWTLLYLLGACSAFLLGAAVIAARATNTRGQQATGDAPAEAQIPIPEAA